MHHLLERDPVLFLSGDVESPLVDRGRREPVVQVEGRVLLEEDRELTALGAEPEAILAPERVDVDVVLLGGQQLAVDPPAVLVITRP
jgi:hypothetical protein